MLWILHLAGQLHTYLHVCACACMCSMDFAGAQCYGSIAHWPSFPHHVPLHLRWDYPPCWLAHSHVPPWLAPKDTQMAVTYAALASPMPKTRCGDGNSTCLCRALRRILLMPLMVWRPSTWRLALQLANRDYTVVWGPHIPRCLRSCTPHKLDMGHVPTSSCRSKHLWPILRSHGTARSGVLPMMPAPGQNCQVHERHGTEQHQWGGQFWQGSVFLNRYSCFLFASSYFEKFTGLPHFQGHFILGPGQK